MTPTPPPGSLPDLTISRYAVSLSARRSSGVVEYTERNRGLRVAGTHNVAIYAADASAPDRTGEILVRRERLASLGAGLGRNRRLSIVIPTSLRTRNFVLRIEADSSYELNEEDELNNLAHRTFSTRTRKR